METLPTTFSTIWILLVDEFPQYSSWRFNIENICCSQPSISSTIFYKKHIMITNII